MTVCGAQTAVVEMLKSLKERGKKLFILTNSPFPFVDGGMRFLFQVRLLPVYLRHKTSLRVHQHL